MLGRGRVNSVAFEIMCLEVLCERQSAAATPTALSTEHPHNVLPAGASPASLPPHLCREQRQLRRTTPRANNGRRFSRSRETTPDVSRPPREQGRCAPLLPTACSSQSATLGICFAGDM